MKEIKAIIQGRLLARVVHALHELPHFPGITVTDVLGQGRGRGAGGEFLLTADNLFFHKKKRIEIVADDAIAGQIVEIIGKSAHTGTHGDGLIIVSDVERCIRIRTGQAQSEAL